MNDICCIGHITLDKIITPKQTTYMPGGTSYYFSHGIYHLNDWKNYKLVTVFPDFATLLSMDETLLREWIQNHPFFGSVSSSSFLLFQECLYDPILTHRVMADPILYSLSKRQQLLAWPLLSLTASSTPDQLAAVEGLLAASAIPVSLPPADAERILAVLQQDSGEAGLLLALRLLGAIDASEPAFAQQQMRVVVVVVVRWGREA